MIELTHDKAGKRRRLDALAFSSSTETLESATSQSCSATMLTVIFFGGAVAEQGRWPPVDLHPVCHSWLLEVEIEVEPNGCLPGFPHMLFEFAEYILCARQSFILGRGGSSRPLVGICSLEI